MNPKPVYTLNASPVVADRSQGDVATFLGFSQCGALPFGGAATLPA